MRFWDSVTSPCIQYTGDTVYMYISIVLCGMHVQNLPLPAHSAPQSQNRLKWCEHAIAATPAMCDVFSSIEVPPVHLMPSLEP